MKKIKENIATISAIILMLSGIVLSFMGFFEPPRGTISDSVLWYFAQTLIYAGSVLGVKIYVDSKLRCEDFNPEKHDSFHHERHEN